MMMFDLENATVVLINSKSLRRYISNTYQFILLLVRNLLMMSAVFSMVGGLFVFIASCALLDGLRKEDERAFVFWLWTMVSTYGIQMYDT